MARLGIGDVGHLIAGDFQQLRQLRPVGGRLIQQHQKLTVGKHQPRRIGAQALLHILRGPSHSRSVFPESLPALVEELRAVKVPEKHVDFINKHPCVFPRQPVRRHTVLYRVHGDGQGGGFELFSHLIEVKGDDPAPDIYVGGMGEHIQAALDEKFRSQGNLLGLPLRLLLDLVAPIGEKRLSSFAAALHQIAVDDGSTTVNDRLLESSQLAHSHLLFTDTHQ